MSSSAVFQRLLLDLWAGIRGVPVSLRRGATQRDQRIPYPIMENTTNTSEGQQPVEVACADLLSKHGGSTRILARTIRSQICNELAQQEKLMLSRVGEVRVELH